MTRKILFDSVGSFLRPKALLDARREVAHGHMEVEEIRKIEDKYIEELINKQKSVGLKLITDGEFRRSWWHLDFFWGLEGVEKTYPEDGYIFHDEETRAESIGIVGKIRGKNHPFIEDFKFVKQFEEDDIKAKQTIPAPAQLYAEIKREEGVDTYKKFYLRDENLQEDIINAYVEFIEELYEAGCRNLQLDDCTWGMFVDDNFRQDLETQGLDIDKLMEEYLNLNNSVIEKTPSDMHVATHICRGNYHSTYAASGGYEKVSDFVLKREKVDCFYLEFDDERSGSFKPLKSIPEDKEVVLGIVTSKSGKLEDINYLKERLNDAFNYIEKERVILSPQCGFSSTEEGNILKEEDQWKKLDLLNRLSKEVLG
ncbi:MAG: 5-methyltetrahydropteroyltriglutamate--homocysteine S-methyltransferase [Tissierellia bacterium]|nr:5-methyltetrahydropteroyltriglutamate--homocysteine S-methyltransferase [Tissierellia bacterium]